MKELPNSKIIVDDEDYNRVNRYRWHLSGSMTSIMRGVRPRVMLANFIMDDYINSYDHKDGNIWNNQKSNLRIASRIQNSYNRSKHDGDYSSEYKGVSWFKSKQKWMVRIKVNKKAIFLGYFEDEKYAAKVYDEAAKKYHKEFANLNFKTNNKV